MHGDMFLVASSSLCSVCVTSLVIIVCKANVYIHIILFFIGQKKGEYIKKKKENKTKTYK